MSPFLGLLFWEIYEFFFTFLAPYFNEETELCIFPFDEFKIYLLAQRDFFAKPLFVLSLELKLSKGRFYYFFITSFSIDLKLRAFSDP